MRHSRISTTMDIYAQIVPTSQRRALQQLSAFAGVGALPAPQEIGEMDLDFTSAEKKNTWPNIYVPVHVPKRSDSGFKNSGLPGELPHSFSGSHPIVADAAAFSAASARGMLVRSTP